MNARLNSGDIALIVGGSDVVGQSIAAGLIERGVTCVMLDVSPSSSIAQVPSIVVDLTDRGAVAAAVADVTQSVGQPTILVIVSSTFRHVQAEWMTDEQWDDAVDTNLHGAYNAAREVVPGMVERQKGRVLFVTGDEGRRGVAGQSHVAAAAWGVIGLAKSIALETAAVGVAVNVLCTGPVEGVAIDAKAFEAVVGEPPEAALATKHPNNEAWVPTGDVVDAAIFLLGRGDTAMSGSVLDISNGLSALNSA